MKRIVLISILLALTIAGANGQTVYKDSSTTPNTYYIMIQSGIRINRLYVATLMDNKNDCANLYWEIKSVNGTPINKVTSDIRIDYPSLISAGSGAGATQFLANYFIGIADSLLGYSVTALP